MPKLRPDENDMIVIKSSLSEALAEEPTIEGLVLHFAKSMIAPEGNSLFISKLSEEMRQSAKFRSLLREEEPNVIKEVGMAVAIILEELCPEVKFSIEGREKTIFSEVNKRISKLLEGNNPQIQDLLALRVIILNEDREIANIERCYTCANRLLEHFTLTNPCVDTCLSWDISVKSVSPLRDYRSQVFKKYPQLLIPEASSLNPLFTSMAKNYIFFPNKQGYQSLHMVITYRGVPVELQIRTLNMHHWATVGAANHKNYKSEKTFQEISLEMFDESKILLPKYILDSNNEVITYPGLVNAIPFFRYSH